MTYVIRWNLKPKSYYRQMTGIGPAFGATINNTPRFASKREAQEVVNRFPMVAACGSVIVPAPNTKRTAVKP